MEASTAEPTFINGEPIAEAETDQGVLAGAADDQLDDLEIQVEAREWVVAGAISVIDPRNNQETQLDFSRSYMQKPLSYTAMLQFTGLIGDRISTVMAQGITLESVLGDVQTIAEVFTSDDGITRGDFSGVDSFVRGLAKLATYLPDVVEECQCIWLRVPLHERHVVKDIWGRSPEDGGLSMQQGEEMLSLFIAQNYQELEDFFVERLPRVLRQSRKARTKKRSLGAGGQQPLKPSNTSAAHTPSP